MLARALCSAANSVSTEELADSHRLSIVCVKACELCAVFIAGSVCVCVMQSSGLET